MDRLPSADPIVRESPSGAAPATSHDCRCACGSLLARRVGAEVELKCRRCKRVLRIPLHDADLGGASA